MAVERSLPIVGYHDTVVPNHMRQPANTMNGLVMMLPGYGYTLDMPLFYYTENAYLESGWDVLRVETAYHHHTSFDKAPDREQAQWVAADTHAAWHAGMAQATYATAMVVGKSLGTLGMASLFSNPISTSCPVRSIWLTPMLLEQTVREAIRRCGSNALIVIGEDDPHYDAHVLTDLERAGVRNVVVPHADHGLDIPGDVLGSVRLLTDVMTVVIDFGIGSVHPSLPPQMPTSKT